MRYKHHPERGYYEDWDESWNEEWNRVEEELQTDYEFKGSPRMQEIETAEFRYGWGARKRYLTSEWSDVEPEIIQDWEQNQAEEGRSWEDARENVRRGWEKAKRKG